MSMLVISGPVYKDKRLTVLETMSFINVILVAVMTILFTESYHDTVSIKLIVSISVSIEIILLFSVVTAHCCFTLKRVLPNCRLCYNIHPYGNDLPLPAGNKEAEESPAYFINHREELIFDLQC